MYQLIKFLQFLFSSKNHHGVHSPFVFQLVTKCLYDKSFYPEYKLLSKYRNELFLDNQILEIDDFGVGSKVMVSKKRTVKQIAKIAGSSKGFSKFAFRLAKYQNVQSILELGTSLGLATSALALSKPNIQIDTVEASRSVILKAENQLSSIINNSKINFHHQTFDNFIRSLASSVRYDLIFFDGNHQKEATLRYFEQLLFTAHNDSVWVFDDIYWSKSMTQAWEIIKEHPKVKVTIDLFQWGLVFFRREQEKEHFKLRPNFV